MCEYFLVQSGTVWTFSKKDFSSWRTKTLVVVVEVGVVQTVCTIALLTESIAGSASDSPFSFYQDCFSPLWPHSQYLLDETQTLAVVPLIISSFPAKTVSENV